MCRCLAVVGLLALMAQGCTKKPESYQLSSQSYPLSSLSVDYQTWNCQQLATKPTCSRMRLRWLSSSLR